MTTQRSAGLNFERALRAVAGAVGLVVALIPIAFFFVAAVAAGLSDNPDAQGPGLAGFLFGGALTAVLATGVGALTLPWRVRLRLRRRHWVVAGCSLVPAYVAAAIPTAFLASALRLPPRGWVILFVALMTAYVYVWAGAITRWTANHASASGAQALAAAADKPSQE